MLIDWDDPAVQAILACHDGRQAWELLLAYISFLPLRQRLEPRDAIWARRREAMPKRGGRAARPRPGRWRDGPAAVALAARRTAST